MSDFLTLKGGEVDVGGAPEVISVLPFGHVVSQKGEFDVDEESLAAMKAQIAEPRSRIRRTIMDERKRLYKSRNNKMICGVCAGIADYFNIDPSIVRVLWAVLALAAGTGVLAYIACAIILPEGDTEV